MENWKLFKSQKHSKGQISFEFIIVLAVVSILASSILADFYFESNDSFILSATKATALKEIYKINSEFNTDCYLKSITIITMINGKTTQLDIEGNPAKCLIDPSVIADSVERDYCGITPNSDDFIDCAEGYPITVI